MLVDHHAPCRLVDEARFQGVEVGGEKFADMAEVEGRRLDILLQLVEILGAGRAPGQHLGSTRLAEALEGAVAHALVGRQVGFLELIDAAAMGGPSDHIEIDVEAVENVHDIEHDVRRTQHIAAGIEQHLRRPPFGWRQDALQGLRGQLHAGEQAHRLRHVTEASGGGLGALLKRALALHRFQPGDGDPLADVDVLGTGVGAAAAAVARIEPEAELFRCSATAAGQRHQFAHSFFRCAGIEPDLARRRTDLEAFAAGDAAIGGLLGQGLQPFRVSAQDGLPDAK